MSELINTHDNRATIRWKLLTGASALALTAYVSTAGLAKAEDTSQPSVWIELDGQFAKQEVKNEAFLPPFLLSSPFDGASQVNRAAPTVWDKGGAISFQPEGTDWVLSADIRFGRATRSAAQNQLTAHPTNYNFNYMAYQNFRARSTEDHTIVDFSVGKDVGMGKFGSGGESVINLGVRYAQFRSQTGFSVHSQPTNTAVNFNRYYASFAAERKLSGIGPSLSWNASANIAGNASSGSLALDWGVNGAVLFGRQREKNSHQTSEIHVPRYAYISSHYVIHPHIPVYQHSAAPPDRSKNVTIPNLGGFAAVSWRLPNAKVSIGYRADFFFGAIDNGLDTRKADTRGYYGPYASISIGIGD